jgi:hypothetical protein
MSAAVHGLSASWGGPLRQLIAKAAAIVVGAWFFLLGLALKSFIFNIYHVVMTSVRWTVEFEQQPIPEGTGGESDAAAHRADPPA